MTDTSSLLVRPHARQAPVTAGARRSRYVGRSDIVSWGRVDRRPQLWARPHFRDEIDELLCDAQSAEKLAIGLRRSYGDSCLNRAGAVIDMTGLDRFVAFDSEYGRLRAEAGVTLSEVLRLVVPKGWFVPTTPGTRFVTLGGAVANDVHGKNHHRAGTFGSRVTAIGLQRSDRGRLTLAADSEPELFRATIGGMGLTGIIEWVEVELARIGSALLDVEILPFGSLEEFWAIAAESVGPYEHTVAWLDCANRQGRGVFTRANWALSGGLTAHDDNASRSAPFDLPSFALNGLTVAAFNEVYFRAHKLKAARRTEHYATYFYPLDAILNWNRLYGARGMLQYQCVIPWGAERVALPTLLEEIAGSGQASFLAVLKTFGDKVSPGLLSFPRPGTTLALDFPNRGEATLLLMGRLDAIVADANGALYPAKDGRMPPDMFRRSFPEWEALARLKDPALSSDFWRRVS